MVKGANFKKYDKSSTNLYDQNTYYRYYLYINLHITGIMFINRILKSKILLLDLGIAAA